MAAVERFERANSRWYRSRSGAKWFAPQPAAKSRPPAGIQRARYLGRVWDGITTAAGS
jgi:hypothetical protein